MRIFSDAIKQTRLYILNGCWTSFSGKHLIVLYLDKFNNNYRKLDD